MKKISIILPTYDRLYSLKEIFLPGLEKQLGDVYELIIIDDNSSDSTENFLNSKEFKKTFPKVSLQTRYYKNKHNLGAPASRNRGVEKAKYEWVYIVEDDIHIDSRSYLQEALKIIQALGEGIAVLSPQRFDVLATGYYKNPTNSFARVGRFSGEVYLDNSQQYTGIVPTTHASSFILKVAYMAVKEDETLFYGNTFRDETDLYAGITKKGYKILYVADKLQTLHRNDFAHSGGQKKISSRSLLAQEWMIWANHHKYLKKHYTYPAFRICAFVVVRLLKIISNVCKIPFIKNFLSLCRI